MSFVATHPARTYQPVLKRVDPPAIATWVLGFGLVLYLGIKGGGYDILVRNQVGVVLWWVVLICAAWAIVPGARLTRLAWIGLGVFTAFVVWTAIVSTSSLSSERSLAELSRVATYLGVLLLAVGIHRDRERALRQTAGAVGAAIAVVAILSLTSRLFPSTFPAAQTTGDLLNGAQPRLSWPLNYWNGLAGLMAIGLPLLLAVATTAKRLWAQAAAAAAIPVVALCAYLTASRGGAVAIGFAVLAFIVLASNRIPKLATMVAAGAGSAILIAGAAHRDAIQNGLTGSATSGQGRQLLLTAVLVCAGVAIAQLGIALASRHGTLPRILRIPRREAQVLTAIGVAGVIVIGIAVGVPGKLSHAWHDFKNSSGNLGNNLGSRFSSFNGEGRYQYWQVAVHQTSNRRLDGSGPGTFQLVWLPHATRNGGYVVNAHSLYVETLSESGVIGLLLLLGFFAVVLWAVIAVVVRARDGERTLAAGAGAAVVAFLIGATVDWLWQLPVLPVAVMLVAAALFAPVPVTRSVRAIDDDEESNAEPRYRSPLALRLGLAIASVLALVAIAVPLATASGVRSSQNSINAGNASAALSDAESAARVEPGASSPQLQLALVLEQQPNFTAAIAAALHATRNEPQNWSNWLVLSRLEAEAGQPKASVAAYERARSLNPYSAIFHQ
jgi:hypothetical protein